MLSILKSPRQNLVIEIMSMRIRLTCLLVVYGSILSMLASSIVYAEPDEVNAPSSLKLLVVTGGPTLRHHVDLVPTSFYTLFEGHENLQWDHASSDEAAFQPERLENYDVLVMYNRSDSLSDQAKENLQAFVESGKGIVVLHHALGSYNDWKWWWQDVVGGKYQMEDKDDVSKSGYKLGEKIAVNVVIDHPITSAVGAFEMEDETYNGLWISPQVKILYETDNQTSDGPLVWTSTYSKSRVVVVQPGHASAAHKNV